MINTKQLQAIYNSDLFLDNENSLDFLVRSNSHECERGVGEGRGIFKFSYMGGGGVGWEEAWGLGVIEDVSVQL